MTDTPIHHWTMDNVTGTPITAAVDEIAGGINLSFSSKTQVSGKFNYGLSGGDTAYPVSLGTDVAFKAISFWIRRINTANYAVFGCTAAGNKLFAIHAAGTGNYLYFFNGSGGVSSNLTITDTTWHHVMVVEGSDVNHHWFWLDGVKGSSELLSNNGGVLQFFSRPSGAAGQENTELDNIQWYDRIPTDDEIAYLAAATAQTQTLPVSLPPAITVTLSLYQPISLAQRVRLSLDQPIALRKLLTLSLNQSCGMELAMSLIQRCRAMPRVTLSLNQWVRSLRQVTLRLDQHVGVCPLVRLSLDQRVRMPGRVTMSLDQAVVIAGQRLTLSLDQHIRMDRNGRVTLSLAQACAIANGTAVSQGISLSVTVGGRVVDPDFVSIKADDSDGFLSATIRFPDFQQYLLCRVGEVVVITELLDGLPAEITVLQVKTLTNPEEPGAADHILTAISPTAALDEGPLTDDLGPGVAADLMTALVAGSSFTLDWQGVVGWPFLAGELMAEDETPYAILVRQAAASGAFLQSLPDGATLRLRPEYAVNVGDWPAAFCDLEINDQDHIFSIDEQPDERDGFNAFLIGGQSAAAGNHRLDDKALTATTKDIRFYQWPFNQAVTIILDHTGGDWVSIDYLGVHEELIEDEEVVITAGIGQLQLPCYGLESYRYKEDPIGALTFEEDGSVATAEIGDALLDVTYRTKFRKWLLTDPRAEHLQIYIDEVI